MNNGLLAWPEGHLWSPGRAGLFAWPPQRRAFKERPLLADADTLGTTVLTGDQQNCSVNLPTNIRVGDLICIAFKCSANNVPGTPAGWTVLQSGAQGTQGNISLIKIADGSEGSTVIITSAAVCSFCALAFRVTGPTGSWTNSTANSGNGATPLIAGTTIASGAAGQMPCLAFLFGTSIGTVGLANLPTSGLFVTENTGVTTYNNYIQNNDGVSRSCFLMWANIVGTAAPGFSGVGTWANFTCNQVLVQPVRAPAAIYR